MTNNSSEKRGKSFATIGDLEIISADITHNGEKVSENLEGVNRDINSSQKIEYDKITGALEGEFTVDHRLFSEDGRQERFLRI